MIVYGTERFFSDLSSLQKNNSYSNIFNDVCDYFIDKNVQELHFTRDIIQNSTGKYSLNKFRIMNSAMKKGKSGSYRCIAVVLPESDAIYLGCIYPKSGADGVDNLSKEKYKEIATYIKESVVNKTFKIINVSLRIIVP
ncbi:MAG: hypothetical protein IT236_11135 [Bacteroidia bacterium]|nr:hypothetical protein [Bacteroidia bacterium]